MDQKRYIGNLDPNTRTFYGLLLSILQHRYQLVVIIFLLCCSAAVVDSIFFGRFYSEVTIEIPFDVYSQLHADGLTGIEAEEKFLAEQVAFLRSSDFFEEALSAWNPDLHEVRHLVKILRIDYSVMRIPLNSSVVIRVESFDPEKTKTVLSAIMTAYQRWFITHVVTPANKQQVSFERENKKGASVLAAQEALTSSDDKHSIPDQPANQGPEQSAREQGESEWLLSGNIPALVKIAVPPSVPEPVNPLGRNLVIGVLAGFFVNFLVVYVLALRKYQISTSIGMNPQTKSKS